MFEYFYLASKIKIEIIDAKQYVFQFSLIFIG